MLYDYESIVRSFNDGSIGRSIYNQINEVNNSDRDLVNLLLFFSENNADKLFEDVMQYIFFERNFIPYEFCSEEEFEKITKHIIESLLEDKDANYGNADNNSPQCFAEINEEYLNEIALKYDVPDLLDHVNKCIKKDVIKFKN
jgi:hypothetical protein